MKPVRVTLVPLVVAFGALFVILPRTGGDATLRMTGTAGSYAFSPEDLEVDAGARIRLVNDSDATHSVTALSDGFDVVVQPGASTFLSPDEEGRFDFFCRFHGTTDDMRGSLEIGDAPAQAPSPDGSPT